MQFLFSVGTVHADHMGCRETDKHWIVVSRGLHRSMLDIDLVAVVNSQNSFSE